MTAEELAFYASPAAMTALPAHWGLDGLPEDLSAIRRCVQGVLLHRDWYPIYGLDAEQVRFDEQHLHSTTEVLARAFEIRADPLTVAREPVDRVVGICRHFALLHTALLRAHRVPARVRCGFANYFDSSKWYDHWITERWDGGRWVRDDSQIDELQAAVITPDFDPYDQPPGRFLSAGEAWTAARSGDIDAARFGIFDMWGLAFIAGNVLADVACLNKVELLPWDAWGIGLQWGPHDQLSDEVVNVIDELATLTASDDFETLRTRYESDDAVRVPADITTFIDGKALALHLDL